MEGLEATADELELETAELDWTPDELEAVEEAPPLVLGEGEDAV